MSGSAPPGRRTRSRTERRGSCGSGPNGWFRNQATASVCHQRRVSAVTNERRSVSPSGASDVSTRSGNGLGLERETRRPSESRRTAHSGGRISAARAEGEPASPRPSSPRTRSRPPVGARASAENQASAETSGPGRRSIHSASPGRASRRTSSARDGAAGSSSGTTSKAGRPLASATRSATAAGSRSFSARHHASSARAAGLSGDGFGGDGTRFGFGSPRNGLGGSSSPVAPSPASAQPSTPNSASLARANSSAVISSFSARAKIIPTGIGYPSCSDSTRLSSATDSGIAGAFVAGSSARDGAAARAKRVRRRGRRFIARDSGGWTEDSTPLYDSRGAVS